MLSLTLHQREALRQAAEQKWLDRNLSFKPSKGIMQKSHTPSIAKAGQVQESEQVIQEVGEKRNLDKAASDAGVDESDESSEASKQALAETGGLILPVRVNSRSLALICKTS